MLEAGADELGCPDFGLRLSHWQGLDILGPDRRDRAQRVDRARRLEAIARYLYVHSPALKLTARPRADGAWGSPTR